MDWNWMKSIGYNSLSSPFWKISWKYFDIVTNDGINILWFESIFVLIIFIIFLFLGCFHKRIYSIIRNNVRLYVVFFSQEPVFWIIGLFFLNFYSFRLMNVWDILLYLSISSLVCRSVCNIYLFFSLLLSFFHYPFTLFSFIYNFSFLIFDLIYVPKFLE